MDLIDRAWLAGLMEGEGCFYAGYRASPCARLAMTDEDVVRRAHAIAGIGRVRSRLGTKEGWQTVWEWAVSAGHEAAALMLCLYPLLGERRRERIRELMEPWLERDDAGKGSNERRKTQCPAGHPYDQANTTRWRGTRKCKTCKREWDAANYLRNAEKIKANNKAWKTKRKAA